MGPGAGRESERLARVVLSCGIEPGTPALNDRVFDTSAEQVLLGILAQGDADRGRAELAAGLAAIDPARELEQAASRGLRFVTPADPEWPSALDDLRHVPPVHDRGGVPPGLWARGPLDLAEATDSVAVVGSRSSTTYGADLAGGISAGLAREGWTVVSGAAFGIDQAAHRGALACRGQTVAVLACGADRVYPAAHRNLIDYIAQVGAVVSEAQPGAAPMRIRFLARNRIIAALTRGTVVVEAALRSGALNTATWGGNLGRALMGVPGPVTSAPSAGVHQLIRGRGAVLVTSPEEVLEAVGPIGQLALPEPREPARPRDLLSTEQRQVLEAVPHTQAVSSERIARTAGLDSVTTRERLAELFDRGFVEGDTGRWRLRLPERDKQERTA